MEPGPFFSVVFSYRAREYGNKLKQRRICLNTEKHFLIGRLAEYWYRLLREVVEPPSL